MPWPIKKLGEITILNPKKSEIKELPDDMEVSFVSMAAVDEHTQSITVNEKRNLVNVRKGYTYFKEGDVLFAKITPCMENGKVAIARNLKNKVGFGSTEFHIIHPKNDVLPEWIFYVIGRLDFREEAEKHMTGTAGQRRVPEEFLKNFEIPLPPLAEQKRIVGILEEADRLRKLNKQVGSKLDDLFANLLHRLLNPDKYAGKNKT